MSKFPEQEETDNTLSRRDLLRVGPIAAGAAAGAYPAAATAAPPPAGPEYLAKPEASALYVTYENAAWSNAQHPSNSAMAVNERTLIFNATDYGVAGDGNSDDTAAWNTLLAGLAPNSRVVLPPGHESLISSTLNVPAHATGVSLGGVGSTIRLAGSASAGTTILNLSPDGATLEGFHFDGGGVRNATGVRPKGARQRVTGCHFHGLMAGGVHVQAGSIQDLEISANFFTGTGYGVLFATAATATRVRIIGNFFTGAGAGDAIEVNTPNGGISDITILGNVINGYRSDNAAQGIGIGLANVTGAAVVGNLVSECSNSGIHIEDRSQLVSVTGNRVRDCGRAGVSVQAGAGREAPNRIVITANIISGCLTSAGSGAIALEGPTAIKHCTIAANVVRSAGRAGATCYGIDLGANGVGHLVTGNSISNTVGSSTAGLRWNNGSDLVLSSNKCFDDQQGKTQQFGMRVQGVNVNVTLLGNQLGGNLRGAIDEATLSSGSTGYIKQHNRPSGIDTPTVLPVISGPISDKSFGSVSPLNGSAAIDQSGGRLYFKYNNAWHYITQNG